MGIFDIFGSSWKKDFEELLLNYRNALESYILKEYKIYDDMRPDDKSLIEDYFKTYEEAFLPLTTYVNPIGAISKEAKKFVVQRKIEILRLYDVYSKYSTPLKRVQELYHRYKRDNIFNQAFGEYLGENYDIDNLEPEQVLYILNNHEDLYLYALDLREQKAKRQRENKERLRERSTNRKIKELIRRQKMSSTEIKTISDHSLLSSELRSRVEKLATDYRKHDIFTRVTQALYPNFESIDILKDAQYVNILAHEDDLLREKEFFERAHKVSGMLNYYSEFLEKVHIPDEHLGIMYCLDHFDELQEFIKIHQKLIQSEEWISNQKELNDCANNLANQTLRNFKTYSLRMYIYVPNYDGGTLRKTLPFNHYSLYAFTYEDMTLFDRSKSYAYVYYHKDKAMKAKESSITCDKITLHNIAWYIKNLRTAIALDGITVVLASSGVFPAKSYVNYHFWPLKKDLERSGIECINIDQIQNKEVKKTIVVVEIVSDVDRLRAMCKSISKIHPGSNLLYISIFNELTTTQFNNLKSV